MKKPNDSEIIEAISKSCGNLSQTAKRLGVSRMTLYDWMRKDETLREELIHAREQLCDMAEDVIVKHLEEGNLKAAVFVLTHIGERKIWQETRKMTNLMICWDFTDKPDTKEFSWSIRQQKPYQLSHDRDLRVF